MFANYVIRAQLTAKMLARRAAYGALAAMLLLIGAIFFGAAFWIYLVAFLGALGANLVLGALFLIFGLLVLLIAKIPPRVVSAAHTAATADPSISSSAREAPPTVITTASLAQAFVIGLTAGRAFRRRG